MLVLLRSLKVLIFAVILFAVLACSDDSSSNNSSNLKTDITGTWTVVRTLVSGSSDFPQGYQDVQEWTFAVNGETATLTTKDGTAQGTWKSSESFADKHWVFEAQASGFLLRVEITAVDKLKGTNDTYYYDAMNQRWILLDAFTIVGDRKK